MTLHVFTKQFTTEHYKAIVSNVVRLPWFIPGYKNEYEETNNVDLFDMCIETPHVQVGGVSWLLAGLYEDKKRYVPKSIQAIEHIANNGFPTINDSLIAKIDDALNITNESIYELNDHATILSFLDYHRGQRIFTISS